MNGIIGAICGDIIGSVREFHPVKVKDFELIPYNSHFTDDTVLTLAVASWLVKDQTHKHRTLVKEIKTLCRKYPRAGYGGRFRAWINSSDHHPYNSWGNGSAMRVSPVAWAGESLQEVEELAKISAEVTHNNPEGIRGAIAVAGATYLARCGEEKGVIREYVEERCFYDLSRSLDTIRPDYSFEVSCQKSVPEAIICFLESYDYEDALRNAISLGGDADTQAAIAGSIAAAYYDVSSVIYGPCMQKLDNVLLNILTDFNEKFMDNG
jgi:ADP-ribosylglycohydrolase